MEDSEYKDISEFLIPAYNKMSEIATENELSEGRSRPVSKLGHRITLNFRYEDKQRSIQAELEDDKFVISYRTEDMDDYIETAHFRDPKDSIENVVERAYERSIGKTHSTT